MRFLLAAVNAKYIHSNPAVYSLRAYAERFCSSPSGDPASSGGTARAEIEIAEYTINQPFWEILAHLYG